MSLVRLRQNLQIMMPAVHYTQEAACFLLEGLNEPLKIQASVHKDTKEEQRGSKKP